MTGTSVATVPAAAPAPAAHAPGTEVAAGSPAQQLATFARSMGLDVTPSTVAPSAGADPYSGPWSQPVSGKPHRALTETGKKLEAAVRAEYAKLPDVARYDRATIDAYHVAILNIRANEHGRVAVHSFSPEMLHGYTLPSFLADQHYPASIIHSLAHARNAGISQAQLTAFIRADMVCNGWLKA